jgi:hypothetical protein
MQQGTWPSRIAREWAKRNCKGVGKAEVNGQSLKTVPAHCEVSKIAQGKSYLMMGFGTGGRILFWCLGARTLVFGG